MRYLLLALLTLTGCGFNELNTPFKMRGEKKEPAAEPMQTEEAQREVITQRAMAEVSRDLESKDKVQFASRIDKTANAIVRAGIQKLRDRGYDWEANKYEMQWNTTFEGYLTRMAISTDDLGDHAPWSQWLADFYDELELRLGEEVCRLLHLDDIKIVNYAVTVVFDAKNPEWDMVEYSLHFVPLAGVCAYWTTYIACSIVTYGAGTAFLICTPLSMLAEAVMVNKVAPPMSDRVYLRANGQGK